VKQSGGSIYFYSEPGQGTTFKIYFPAVDAAPEALPGAESDIPIEGGDETVLLAEDDGSLRDFVSEILGSAGYRVLLASNGQEAEEASDGFEGEIHLFITDVVMPVRSGPAAVEALSSRRRAMKVLYVSGYAPNAIHVAGRLRPGVQLLQKPFSATDLLRKVREVLNSDAAAGAETEVGLGPET
jgi:two-component system cell cycle sensor histidine kinase/response regulator CckA